MRGARAARDTAPRRVAAIVAPLAATALLAGCGQVHATSSTTTSDATDAMARLNQLYDRIAGTPLQREAGEIVAFHRYQDAIAGCMAAHGVRYLEPRYIPTWMGLAPDAGTTGTNWLAPLGGAVASDQAQRLAPAQRAELASETGHLPASMSKAEQDRYWAALGSCPNPSTGYEEANHPAESTAVLTQYTSMLDKVDAAVAHDAAGYAGCMSGRGYSAGNYLDARELVQRALPSDPNRVPDPGADGDAQWQAALAAEARIVDADRACRQAVQKKGMLLLAPQIAPFEQAHASELTAVQAGWQRLVDQAHAYPEADEVLAGPPS